MQQVAKEILLRAKKDVFSGNLGNYLTTFKGDGLDFREIRDYEYGDDIRKINWKATAKSNTLKTNVFNEERELNIVIVFMLSGTLHFGSVKLKQEVVTEIMALLAFSSIKSDNRLQSIFFEKKLEKFFEPTKNDAIIYQLVDSAIEFDILKREFDYREFCNFVNGVLKQKSLIFMVGDFYGDVDLSEIAHKNEVYAIIVRDRLEENPILTGEFELIDPNSLNAEDITLNREIAEEYRKIVDKRDREMYEHFLQHQIAYGKIYTNDDIYIRLSEIIKGS